MEFCQRSNPCTVRDLIPSLVGEKKRHALPCHILSIYFLQQTPIFAQNNPIIHSSFSLSSSISSFSIPPCAFVHICVCVCVYIFHSFFPPFAIFNSPFHRPTSATSSVNYYRIVASHRRIRLPSGKRNCYLY